MAHPAPVPARAHVQVSETDEGHTQIRYVDAQGSERLFLQLDRDVTDETKFWARRMVRKIGDQLHASRSAPLRLLTALAGFECFVQLALEGLTLSG